MFHVEHFASSPTLISGERLRGSELEPIVPRGTSLWKPSPNIALTPAIDAKYNSLVPALESGIAKAADPNYPALKSLGSP
jgi:hypothetical protein